MVFFMLLCVSRLVPQRHRTEHPLGKRIVRGRIRLMTIVLVHGNPETDALWDPFAEVLGRDDVVRLSPPGSAPRCPTDFRQPSSHTVTGSRTSSKASTDRSTSWATTSGE